MFSILFVVCCFVQKLATDFDDILHKFGPLRHKPQIEWFDFHGDPVYNNYQY